jgi:hypothetical protein
MENHHFIWENPLVMVMFNSYVKLPEGMALYTKMLWFFMGLAPEWKETLISPCFGLPSAWNMSLPCFMATAKTLRQFPALGLSIGHREPVMRKPLLPLHMLYIYIYTVSICIHVLHRWCMCIYKHIPPGRTFAQSFMGIHGVFSYVVICSGFISDLFRVCLGLV